MMIRRILAASAILVPCIGLAWADEPPKQLVDKGACPSECCTYGQWKAKQVTTILSAPQPTAQQIGIVRAGETVKALTGEVHVEPSKFVVHNAHGKYKPGDELWVYTYSGEGMFKVWFGGKMYGEDLGFSPYDGSPGSRCEDTSHCWGTLQNDIASTWWIQLRTKDGKTGWTTAADQFSGKDRCGR